MNKMQLIQKRDKNKVFRLIIGMKLIEFSNFNKKQNTDSFKKTQKKKKSEKPK